MSGVFYSYKKGVRRMDAKGIHANRRNNTMTIAEMSAQRESTLNELRHRVEAILREQGKPLSLAEIQYYLQGERIKVGDPYATDDTFDVREAISDLIKSKKAEETVGRSVQLIAG